MAVIIIPSLLALSTVVVVVPILCRFFWKRPAPESVSSPGLARYTNGKKYISKLKVKSLAVVGPRVVLYFLQTMWPEEGKTLGFQSRSYHMVRKNTRLTQVMLNKNTTAFPRPRVCVHKPCSFIGP